ncbi:MAG TPA: isochorismatase family protein [Caldilineaceae bacterium]|nr:isochorismatase family protein [Caldilineaceae bacterium]
MVENDTITFNLRRWQLVQDQAGHNRWDMQMAKRSLDPKRVAIIICDMWDNHWSRGAVVREEQLIPRVNQVLAAARDRGIQIIHAPSETMAFYADHPARQRMLAIDTIQPPTDLAHETPPLPVDASDHGSDTGERTTYKAWSRQHPAIVIDDEQDLISDDGREIYSCLQQQGMEQVLILGVHTNMCVLNRSFAIKQMVRWGVAIALVRDLTDTMYNPAMPPYVSHEEGTRLVVEYIEKFWCPSLLSEDLL